MSLWLGLAVIINLNFSYQAVIGNASIAVLLLTLQIPAALWADLVVGRFTARADGLEMLDSIREAVDGVDLAHSAVGFIPLDHTELGRDAPRHRV